MLWLDYCEFYITNVCNLSCTGCNRFNDYNFSGYQSWHDYHDVYKHWSQQLNIGTVSILGGEPMLNPTFMDWVRGVRELWPRSPMRIITNGFRLDKCKDLYSMIKDDTNISIWVGLHNKQHRREILGKVRNFLCEPCTLEFNSENYYQQFLTVTDINGVKIRIEYNWWFHQGAIVKTNLGKLTLHQSDPEVAHETCHMKTCHHFIRGELFKCGVVALLPEFDQQHKFDLDVQDRHLLTNYKPLRLDDSQEDKIAFLENIKKPIAACRFCPEVYIGDQIWAIQKKHRGRLL